MNERARAASATPRRVSSARSKQMNIGRFASHRITRASTTDLSRGVADAFVEFFSFEHEKVLVRLQYAAFGGNGTRSHDVITRDHANDHTGALTFLDRFRHLDRCR